MKVPKQKIEQLFTLQPGRAVDIIFSQNKPQQLHEFYTNLQQHKKNNTIALKKTLQQNYQKMLYCAQLLQKVRKYADAVKQVAEGIHGQVGKEKEDENYGKKQGGGIEDIERKVRKGKLGEAMADSFGDGQWTDSDQYYLFYLRIQIIEKLQRQICLFRLDQAKLTQYTKCLQQFIFGVERSMLKMREQIPNWTSSFAAKSLLGLIHKHSDQLSRCFNQQQSKSTIFQLLFQYKLSTLKNKYKKDHSLPYFHQYFIQLATIIELYQKLKLKQYPSQPQSQQSTNRQHNRLKEIYKASTDQIKQQLASIFIYKQPNGQIVFKSQLYQSLIRDTEFQNIMGKFYERIGKGRGGEVQNPVTFIKQLWHDYFINLIDMLIDQTNPLSRLETLKQHMHPHEYIPPELRPYLHDHSLQQSLHIISQFSKKLQLLNTNLLPIIKKCSPQQLSDLQQKFNNKIHQLTQKCMHFLSQTMHKNNQQIQETDNRKDQLFFRKFILLRILVGMMEQLMTKFNAQFRLRLDDRYMSQRLKVQEPDRIWAGFLEQDRDEFVSESLIKFDCFFIGYIEGVSQEAKTVVSAVISEITLSILSYVRQQVSGKQKDMLTHTVQSLKQKKQKVTILDTIGVPYLAKNIFECVMKPIKIQKQFYQKHFVCKPTKKNVNKVVESSIDDFEIGQKQQKQEFIKVNNIGKSLMSLGNNLITGFMKKK